MVSGGAVAVRSPADCRLRLHVVGLLLYSPSVPRGLDPSRSIPDVADGLRIHSVLFCYLVGATAGGGMRIGANGPLPINLHGLFGSQDNFPWFASPFTLARCLVARLRGMGTRGHALHPWLSIFRAHRPPSTPLAAFTAVVVYGVASSACCAAWCIRVLVPFRTLRRGSVLQALSPWQNQDTSLTLHWQ
jgi:hypothetical protein